MNIRIPRGTQDILPGKVEQWQYIEEKAATFAEGIITKKYELLFLSKLSFFKEGLATQLILYKKKCTPLKTEAGEA